MYLSWEYYFNKVSMLGISDDNSSMDFTGQFILFSFIIVDIPFWQTSLALSVNKKEESDLNKGIRRLEGSWELPSLEIIYIKY